MWRTTVLPRSNHGFTTIFSWYKNKEFPFHAGLQGWRTTIVPRSIVVQSWYNRGTKNGALSKSWYTLVGLDLPLKPGGDAKWK
jgi:hypothetical protein